MERPKQYRLRLLGLSLGILLALCLWPATCWIVRTQAALVLPVGSSVTPWSFDNRFQSSLHTIATQHPDDYVTRLADALTDPPPSGELSSDIKIARLRAMETRFPERASLYANILRFATQGQVLIHREEAQTSIQQAKVVGKPTANTPENLAAFDREALAGERLDPDNAYFPMMCAVGLFAAHRDTEALAALHRAAGKSQWAEYYDDEVHGEWQLHEERFGKTGVIPQIAFAAAILFPHLSQIRNASRVAIALAAEAEQAGRTEEGFAIRNDVRHCGSLMRVQAHSVIGTLVGIAITRLSQTRTEGKEADHTADPQSKPEPPEAQLIRYDAYLARIGHSEESAAVHAEIEAGVQARTFVQHSINQGLFGTELLKIVSLWIGGVLLLCSACWLLVLGGVSSLLERHRRVRTGQGLPPYARRGSALGLLSTVLLGVSLLCHSSFFRGLFQGYSGEDGQRLTLSADAVISQALPWIDLCVWIGMSVCVALLMLPGLTRSEKFRSLGVFGATSVGLLLLGSIFAFQVGSAVSPIATLVGGFGIAGSAQGIEALAIAAAALPILMLLFTLGVLSVVWRTPLSVGLVRGVRGCAVPVACVLLLGYGILVPITLQHETADTLALQRILQHEGRYMAEITGKEWPGPTR